MRAAADALWHPYAAAAGLPAEGYDVATFGDGPALADKLLALVLTGTKRATASLVRDVVASGGAMPRAGGHAVVLDGSGMPRCIFRTTEARVGALVFCDASFAWDEGEGDRSLADWLDGHRRYFARQAAREGFVFDEATTPAVFERFTVVWPPEVADADDRSSPR